MIGKQVEIHLSVNHQTPFCIATHTVGQDHIVCKTKDQFAINVLVKIFGAEKRKHIAIDDRITLSVERMDCLSPPSDLEQLGKPFVYMIRLYGDKESLAECYKLPNQRFQANPW